MTTVWSLTYEARPWLVNAERAGGARGVGGWAGRAALTREWREAFVWIARRERVPPLAAVRVRVVHECRTRRLPDVCACLPAVKAAIDGLVDAGVLAGDGPAVVRSVTFDAPTHTGRDAVTLVVEVVESGP